MTDTTKTVSTRHALQAQGKHPAPCARICEATAFEIEIRQLKADNDALRSHAHRLALDLECLLLSTDNPASTKWWAEANATLQAWRDFNRGASND